MLFEWRVLLRRVTEFGFFFEQRETAPGLRSGAALKAPDQGLGAEEIGRPYLIKLKIRVIIRENECPY